MIGNQIESVKKGAFFFSAADEALDLCGASSMNLTAKRDSRKPVLQFSVNGILKFAAGESLIGRHRLFQTNRKNSLKKSRSFCVAEIEITE